MQHSCRGTIYRAPTRLVYATENRYSNRRLQQKNSRLFDRISETSSRCSSRKFLHRKYATENRYIGSFKNLPPDFHWTVDEKITDH